MEATNVLSLENFIIECNDMLSGKFLDLSKRLEKFLSVMAKSGDIMNLLTDSLEDFDEDEEFSKAFQLDRKTGDVKVSIPTDDKKRLALTATIFYNISSEKLNANQFLETFFKDQKITPMQNFLQKIVKPFRDLVCKSFEIDTAVSADDLKKMIQSQKEKEEVVEEKNEPELPHIDDITQEISKICNQIQSLLKFERKKEGILEDVEFITNAILHACENHDLMEINGLVIGLNYICKKVKNLKSDVEDMNDIIYNYYEYLSGDSNEDEDEIE